jgi:putative intracellular protease/amidase
LAFDQQRRGVYVKTAYVLLQNGFADWEAAAAMAELQRTFGFPVKTVGLTREAIVSMGGLRVTPDLELAELAVESAAILVLPGGDSWTRGEIREASQAVRAMVEIGRPVAAICAATLALAHCGLLNHHLHTSNGRDFIGYYVPEYRGQELYRALPCVRDRGVITANGLAPFAFAAEIFRELAPERASDIATYVGLYAKGLLD